MPLLQSNFLQSLGWAVLDSFWQMAIIWLIYQLITAAYKNIPAAHKSALAATSLITGFVWFLISLAGNMIMGHNNSFLQQVILPPSGAINNWINALLPYAAVGYLLLLFIPLWQFYRNYKYVTIIRTTGLSKPVYEWRLFTTKIAAHIGITKKVTLRLSSIVQSPLTVGFLKPMILLPVAAVNQLTTQQIESVVLHELAHIRRFDYLINLICRFIQTLLYCNPFVGYFVREHETEREKAADQLVLQFEYDAHAYASALVTLQQLAHQTALFTMAATGNKNELLQRVEWIMGIGKRNKLSLRAIFTPLLVIAFFAGVNSLLKQVKKADNFFAQNVKNNSNAFTNIAFPHNTFFTITDQSPISGSNLHSQDAITASDKTVPVITGEVMPAEEDADEPVEGEVFNPFVHAVSALTQVAPTLDKEQEKEVQKAIDASKKVIAEISWKEMEKDFAEALSTLEKEQVKEAYNQRIAQAKDWDKLERKLKASYDKLNWEQLNNTLQAEVNKIRVDSVEKAFTQALAELNIAKKELIKAKEKGIPDSDITLSVIDQQRKATTRLLQAIDSVKKRKIVEL